MIKKRFLKEWGMTDLYSKLDNTTLLRFGLKTLKNSPFFYHIYLILW
ncbi:hypothetical protein CHC179_12880 [Helicobacter pylori]